MTRTLALILLLALPGCASLKDCSVKGLGVSCPFDEPAAPTVAANAPISVEYTAPLIQADGTVDEITIEDNDPTAGILVLLCKALPPRLVCITNENGKAGIIETPMLQRDPLI